jgi:hypothetical protein
MLAKDIFFATNHFRVLNAQVLASNGANGILFVSKILPQPFLRFLRSLKLKLNERDLETWRILLQNLSAELHLQNLIIRTVFEERLPSWPSWSNSELVPKAIFGSNDGIDIIKRTVDLIWPVNTLTPENSANVPSAHHDQGNTYVVLL